MVSASPCSSPDRGPSPYTPPHPYSVPCPLPSPGEFAIVKCHKMPSTRGFSLRKHIFRVTKFVSDLPGNRFGNFSCVSRKLLNFLKIDPKFMCMGLKSGYVSLTDDGGQRGGVPKGLMAVYIGREDRGGGELRRVLVPVVYFNHPLFGELLREAEEEYGFSQQGGITIPCGVSEFEHVKTCVAAVSRGGSGPRRRKALLCGCS